MNKHTREIILSHKERNPFHFDSDVSMESLHKVIASVETHDAFCKAHELVSRNRITNKRFKILDAVSDTPLKPFYFLINKN